MMEFLIMHETRVHLLVCMNIWTKNSLPTDLAKMFSYIRIHSNEQNILNEFYRCVENRRSQHGMPIVEVAITIHGRTHHAMVDGGWLEASAENNIYWRSPSYLQCSIGLQGRSWMKLLLRQTILELSVNLSCLVQLSLTTNVGCWMVDW